jgi:GntR family transcriptional regulator
MPPDRSPRGQLESRRPLVDRARRELLQGILDHRFEDKLPAEIVLAKMLNVSRTTIRAALQGLEQDGLITRRRSVGTTINRPAHVASMPLHRMVAFDWVLKEQGYAVSSTSVWSVGLPDPQIAAVFDLDPRREHLLSEMSYEADGKLAIHLKDVVPLASARPEALTAMEELQAAGPSLFDISVRFFTSTIQGATAQITPMIKRRKADTSLDLPRSHAFVRLHERHVSIRGDVMAYSVVDVDDRYIRFEVYRRR